MKPIIQSIFPQEKEEEVPKITKVDRRSSGYIHAENMAKAIYDAGKDFCKWRRDNVCNHNRNKSHCRLTNDNFKSLSCGMVEDILSLFAKRGEKEEVSNVKRRRQ